MKNEIIKDSVNPGESRKYAQLASAVIVSIVFAGGVYVGGFKGGANTRGESGTVVTEPVEVPASITEDVVAPALGVELPVRWGNLGSQLVEVGVIDGGKFKAMYDKGGAFTEEYKTLLLGQSKGNLKITKDNAAYLLNLFWALGLAGKNSILDSGEMADKQYGGAEHFASTGGWTLAKGSAMDYYSKHVFFELTTEQQALVDKVSRGIYRPCCNNSTHFPDCNHGMAMLGLLELMASQGTSEQEMWKAALVANSYWFTDNYLAMATYMKGKGVEWKDVSPQEMLGFDYSSASGYSNIASHVTIPQRQRGGSCGVGPTAPSPVVKPKEKSAADSVISRLIK